MNTNLNMANREVCDIIIVDYKTKKPFLNLDFANVTTVDLSGDAVYAYGGQGHPKRVQFTGDRGGTITIETQMQSPKLWQMITGGDISKTAEFLMRTKLKTEDGTSVTLPETPIAGTVIVYAEDDDNGEEISCSVTNDTITFTNPLTAGDSVIVYYMKQFIDKTLRISIKSTSFPRVFTFYAYTVMKTENGDVLPYRYIAYKCAPQSNLSLSYSNTGDPGTITITCDLLADNDNNLVDLILEEEDE